MAKGWSAADMLATEKNFRRAMGHKDLWRFKRFSMGITRNKHEKQLDCREKVA